MAQSLVNDALIRHQIFLQRRGAGIYKDLVPILVEMQRRIEAQLDTLTDFGRARASALYREIDLILQDTDSLIAEQLIDDLDELAEYEAKAHIVSMGKVTNAQWTLPSTELLAAVTADPVVKLSDGKTVKQMTVNALINQYSEAQAKRVRAEIEAGLLSGDSVDKIRKRVNLGLTKTARAQAEAVVRTSVNAITGEARQQVYRANADLIKGYKWLATLDNRTTPICQARDGKEYPADDHPTPPAHYNCRSVIIPVLHERFQLKGTGERTARNLETGKTEMVSSKTTYNSWLKQQPAEVQDEILGGVKGALFRRGGLSVDKFVTDDGISYSKEQLQANHPLEWAQAFPSGE